jgi:hypothetical protein
MTRGLRDRRLASLSTLAMLIVFGGTSYLLIKNELDIRSTARWLLGARKYIAAVLALPQPSDKALKHVEWDGWGFPGGGDTKVYVVFDSNDLLSKTGNLNASGKFPGLPCAVYRIHRLEHAWYTVSFYTDTDWEHCA